MFFNTYSAPSAFDRSVLYDALSEFISVSKVDYIPKWKKTQLNSQAIEAKEKLEKCAVDFDIRDIQAMLAASMLMLSCLEDIAEPDNETIRQINACTRNINFCKDIFDDIPI